MSEKEKAMLEKLAALPAPLQDRFLDRIQGATMALDMLGATAPKEGGQNGPGEGGLPRNDGGS